MTKRYSIKELLLVSFIPVMVVIAAIFLVALYVEFKAVNDSLEVTVIDIQPYDFEGTEPDEENPQGDVTFSSDHERNPILSKATELIGEKRWPEAEAFYLESIKGGASSSVINDLGVLYYKNKDYNRAVEIFTSALGERPVYTNTYFNRGLAYSKLGRHEEAALDFGKFSELLPNNFNGHYNLGLVLLRSGNNLAAVGAMERAAGLSAGGKKSKSLYFMGIALRELGGDHKKEAGASFRRSINLAPDSLRPRIALAMLDADTERGQQRALRDFEKIFNLSAKYAPAHFHYGRLKSIMGEKEEAIRSYEEAIALNPEYRKARYNLGVLLLSAGRASAARGIFEWVVRRDPKYSEGHFNLGRVEFMSKNYAESVREYRTAIKLKGGDYPEAYLNLGLVYAAQRKYNNATVNYKKALSLNERYPQAHYNLGIVYMKQKNYESAMESFREALKLDESFEKAWFNLGIIYSRRGEEALAIESYRRALEVDPAYPQARLNLGVLLARGGNLDEAVREYKRLLEVDSTYATAWLNLAFASVELGDIKDGERAFRKVIDLEPGNTKAMLNLGRLLSGSGDYGEAVEVLKEAIEFDVKDTRLRLALARVYRASGDDESALEVLNKALRLDPKSKRLKKELKDLTGG